MSEYHTSVLIDEVLDYLRVSTGKRYIDATLGGGGHSFEIVKRGGHVLGIDQDDEAICYVTSELSGKAIEVRNKLQLVRGNFIDIKKIAIKNNFENLDGILLDLGVSSHQFNTHVRGFSFQYDGPLDMRMDKTLSVRAADLVNGLTVSELARLFEKYGEERRSKHIAKLIVEERKNKLFETTLELANTIERNVRREEKIHPATRVFQALRIAVNDELLSLERVLPDAFELLKSGGRLCVISFHSLEDRIVKNTFKDFVRWGNGRILTDKPVTSSDVEREHNKRSRSAKLRVIERI